MIDYKIDYKKEAIKLWNHDPCGAGMSSYPIGSREFFEDIDRKRYKLMPWMHETFQFDKYYGKKVLEIGVGIGTDHAQFAKSGAFLTGIDISPRSIELTRQRFNMFGLHSNLLIADAEALPFEDETFDAVFSFGVLHHTPNFEKAIKEIYRILKPGGEAVIGLYNKNSIFYRIYIVFYERILHSNIFHEPIEERLGKIEYSTIDAKPLVRLFTVKELKNVFSHFSDKNFFIRHFEPSYIPFFNATRAQKVKNWVLSRRPVMNFLGNHFGWYIIVKANK